LAPSRFNRPLRTAVMVTITVHEARSGLRAELALRLCVNRAGGRLCASPTRLCGLASSRFFPLQRSGELVQPLPLEVVEEGKRGHRAD